MTFAHPLVLGALPVVLLAVWWCFRQVRTADGPAFAHLTRLWTDGHGLSDRPVASRRRARGVGLAAGAVLALLALARPQWGEVAEQTYDQSREVMLALDLSRSMLADDVSPSRLARAKLLIESLLDELKGERVGLIVFAGTAFTQSPLSADYEVLRDFLAELDPSYLPQGGTDYEAMLKTAVQAFGQQRGGDRYLVVLSDGEAHDEGWKALLPELRSQGIRVIGLGVGTPQGGLVPAADGGLLKDETGNAVLSKLEPATLRELAEQTSGTYRDAATWVDIAELVEATVEQGRKGRYVEERNLRLQDRFQWFLAPALLCLLLSLWIEYPVSPLARAVHLRGRRPHPTSASIIAAVFVALVAWPSLDQARAAVSDAAPPSDTAPNRPSKLENTIEELIAQPELAATDYARLATDTIAFASQPAAPKGAPRNGVIDDALAAVARGEGMDAAAADWPTLREELARLRNVKDEPPAPQDQQPQQQQGQQRGGGDQQNDSQQANQSSRGQGPKQSAEQQPGKSQETQQADGSGTESSRNKSDAGDDQMPTGRPGDSSARPSEEHGQQPQAGDEVARQDDAKPLDAPEAGLGDQEKPQDAKDAVGPAAPADSARPETPQQTNSRMVGGGRALRGVEPQGDMALAEALGTMERVKDGDAPAVLFERMNRVEGQPPRPRSTKNW